MFTQINTLKPLSRFSSLFVLGMISCSLFFGGQINRTLPVHHVGPIQTTNPVLPSTGDVQIGLYDTLELVFAASTTPQNPFDTYLLRLEVTDPTGKSFEIDGFYDGNGKGGQQGNIWKARITPYMQGKWTWRTVTGDQPDSQLRNQSGEFDCLPNSNTGGVVRNGKYFNFQNGQEVYLVGNFLDFTGGVTTTHTYMSETLNDGQRNAILQRQRDFHTANKANIYFANRGDYDDQSVTPWLGRANQNDKTRMDLSRWRNYDQYIQRFKENRILAEMWFYADDSKFKDVSEADKRRLVRYAMARTSAFSHTMYVIALEWQEDWSRSAVSSMGTFIQDHNPWGRMISVHSVTQSEWEFSGEGWATFIASQTGNDHLPPRVNRYAIEMWEQEDLPHLSEEFGYLYNDSDDEMRAKLWAAFTGGAAGSGTGSDLKALNRFLAESKVPFQRMAPANDLVDEGGKTRFALAESGHHYVVYSSGGSFSLEVSGSNLMGRWFNPRTPNASLGAAFSVAAGRQNFTPPSAAGQDWVLWISDGSQLNPGITHPSAGGSMLTINLSGVDFSTDETFLPLIGDRITR